ncbi:MAG: glycosyltransferase family 4 protein [Tannerella sp.]|jgi:glycosyltransferase involved in cell wall biosynthesis|nr:glycosyltransferase family 4 protein [Tannerella sp.]
MINVLYNALHLTGSFSGVQHTEEQLMKTALFHPYPEIRFEALCPENYQPDFRFPSHPFIRVEADMATRWKRIGYEHLRMNRCSEARQTHILHCPAYVLPWRCRTLSIVTVHDTIALDFPEYCPPGNSSYFRIALPRSVRQATKIIAVSHTVKCDILRHFSVNPDKIEVIYHGIDDRFKKRVTEKKLSEVRRKYDLPEKFILFVGNIEPKKNISRLIDACLDVFRQSRIPHSLVVAGRFTWKSQNVQKKIARCKDRRILCTGYIDSSDLPAVYTLADLFVFPSLYEGFGLPPLEAMACGTPVIVSGAGALPEITAGHALTVDPLSVESVGEAIYRMLHEPSLRSRFIESGRQHACGFQWETAWRKTAGLYDSVYRKYEKSC